MDLTTLEGADTPGKVRALCAKARRPDPADPTAPQVAAVCVYPDLVAVASQALAGSGVKVASVATGFPRMGATPIASTRFRVSGSARPVITSTGMVANASILRRRSRTRNPSPAGSPKSSRMRSGRSRFTTVRAEAASAAWATI